MDMTVQLPGTICLVDRLASAGHIQMTLKAVIPPEVLVSPRQWKYIDHFKAQETSRETRNDRCLWYRQTLDVNG